MCESLQLMLMVCDSFNIKLSLEVETIRRFHMRRNIPIAGHREFHYRLVTTRRYFGCRRSYGKHAGMRHVSFQCDFGSSQWFSGYVSQVDSNRGLPHARRLWRNFVGDCEVRKRFVLTPATE